MTTDATPKWQRENGHSLTLLHMIRNVQDGVDSVCKHADQINVCEVSLISLHFTENFISAFLIFQVELAQLSQDLSALGH